jgi:hypothetical protein
MGSELKARLLEIAAQYDRTISTSVPASNEQIKSEMGQLREIRE